MRTADAMTDVRRSEHVGKATFHGRLSGYPCRLCVAGIGTVNTASALTHEIDRERPDLAIQIGIAGAYVPSGLAIGAAAVASEEIYGDAGVLTPGGWRPMEAIGFPLVPGDPPLFNRFPLDDALTRRAAEACGAARGPFVTLSQCTGVRAVGDALCERFGAICENMEGAAAAHVCALYRIPFLEVRGISNRVEDRDPSRWDIPGATMAAHEALMKILRRQGLGARG